MSTPASAPSSLSGDSQKILLIDDVPAQSELLKLQFKLEFGIEKVHLCTFPIRMRFTLLCTGENRSKWGSGSTNIATRKIFGCFL